MSVNSYSERGKTVDGFEDERQIWENTTKNYVVSKDDIQFFFTED